MKNYKDLIIGQQSSCLQEIDSYSKVTQIVLKNKNGNIN